MNFRKNSILIIGGSIAAVFLLIAVYFLATLRGSYQKSLSALTSSQQRLNALNTRNPYPSSENVQLAAKNLEALKARFEALQEHLIREQIKTELIEPARFAPMLEETSRRIRSKAAAGNVGLPVDPGLGFKDYAAGKLPPNEPRVMERLVVQIRALEDLIDLAIEAKVASIDLIQRDEFELRADTLAETVTDVRGRGRAAAAQVRGPTPATTRPLVGGLPLAEANDQYTTERFVIGVTGREAAIWDVLNRLLSRRINYTIVDLTLDNPRTDLGRPVDMKAKLTAVTAAARQTSPGPGGTAPAIPEVKLSDLSREERVIGGRDPIKARLVVDMHRFTNAGEGEDRP